MSTVLLVLAVLVGLLVARLAYVWTKNAVRAFTRGVRQGMTEARAEDSTNA